MDLSIIIVNYNVKEFLQNLLNSLEKASAGLNTEIIVVDNASDDGSVEVIEEKYPEVKLIANKENAGFGKANNQGMDISTGDYILLINPDTIVKEDSFTRLIDFFERTPDAGMAGCKVLNPDGSLQLPCRRSFPGPWTSFTKVTGLSKLFPNSSLFARYNLTYLDENETYEVDAISGAFMMFRREVYEKTGGFDPVFFMYGEDLDLCYRTQKAGYKVYYAPVTEIIHYKGESTKRSNLDETRVFYDAMHLFVKKHFSTSFLVEWILQLAILLRKFIAFINVYRLVIIAVILDFLFFSGAIYFAEKVYDSPHWTGFPDFVTPWVYIIPPVIQIVISAVSGIYGKEKLSIARSLVSIFFGFILLSSLTYFFKQFAYSRAVILITYAFVLLFFTFWRLLFKLLFGIGITRSFRNSRTLIVGQGEKAAELAGKLKSSFMSIHHVAGLIGFTYKDIGRKVGEFEIVGSLDNIKKVIRELNVKKVIFSSDQLTFEQMFYVISVCQGENLEFMVAGSNHDFLVGKSSTTMLEDIPLFTVDYRIINFSNRIIKRAFDLIIAFPLLLFVYPFVYLTGSYGGKKKGFREFVLGIPSVIRGRKSLVGISGKEEHQGVYLGKPGLTGLWYIEEGYTGERKAESRLDLYYAKNQNFWLDSEILGRSFAKMLNRKRK